MEISCPLSAFLEWYFNTLTQPHQELGAASAAILCLHLFITTPYWIPKRQLPSQLPTDEIMQMRVGFN